MKYILILFLVSTHLIASNQTKKIVLKAKQKNDIVHVKTTIPYKSMTYFQAQRRRGDKSKAHFITQVSAEINNQTVFYMSTGSSLSEKSQLKFSFLANDIGDTLKIIARDNNGKVMSKSQKIKGFKKTVISIIDRNETNYRLTKPSIWGDITIDKAITGLYGKVDFVDNGIKLNASKCVYNKVPVKITSDLELTSIAIFQSSYPHPTAAVITVFDKQPIDYLLWINVMSQGSNDIQEITVIGQDREGKLYRARHRVKVINYHHHCNEDGEVEYDL